MSARVRIDLTAGVLEAEGSEDFIRELYLDFKTRVAEQNRPAAPASEASSKPASGEAGSGRKKKAERRSGGTSKRDRTPVLVKELDLAPKGNRPGLKDFVKKYAKLRNAMEWNALFVYYLSRELTITPITIDHVYTCYKHIGARVPTVLTQSLWDTARRKGTVDTSSLDDIKLTTAGENWVDHDLPKAGSE